MCQPSACSCSRSLSVLFGTVSLVPWTVRHQRARPQMEIAVRIVDRSQPLGPRTARSSDHPQVEFPTLRWYSKDGMITHRVIASLHSGTHVDAPVMYDSNGLTIDQLSLDGFWGMGYVADIALPERGFISGDHLEKVAG